MSLVSWASARWYGPEDKGFETLAEDVVAFMGKTHPEGNYTFKVNARRARKDYPMLSMEVNAALGEKLLKAFPETKVDVHDPEIVVNVEIRDEIYVYSKIIPGPGGMPVGANGKAMLLLSGGIDSPVAGYMVAKRGVLIDAVYFHAPPYTSERAKAEGCGSGKDHFQIYRTDQSSCGEFYRYSALHL